MSSDSNVVPFRDNKSPNGDGQPTKGPHSKFGDRLRYAADLKGFTAAKLAAKFFLTRGTFSRYWNGLRPLPSDLLFGVADALECNPRWLAIGEGSFDPPVDAQAGLDDISIALRTDIERLDPAQRIALLQFVASMLSATPRPR